MTFVADRGDIAQRLDQAVLRHLPNAFGLSRSRIQRLVAAGRVLVNGAPARRPAQRLTSGDLVAVDAAAAPPPVPAAAEALPLDVVYEDDELLVVNKAAGMVSHPTSARRSGTVINALLGRAGGETGPPRWEPRLVQRLDKDTSGLMIVAKSGAVQSALQRDRDDVVKDYLAVVWGRPSPRRGALDGLLGRDPLDRRRMVVRHSGAPSLTSYAVLAHSTGERAGLSLVSCRLGTGRTHQIRVHLADRGWPLVGDPTYGQAPRRRLPSPTLDRHARGFARQALHAWRIQLRLPASGRVITLEAPPPADLGALIAAAGLGRGLPRS